MSHLMGVRMINISGITLPETAIWENELIHGQPKANAEQAADGKELIFQWNVNSDIDIYIPKIAGELTRESVEKLKALSETNSQVALNINGVLKKAVFRHHDTALELKPINAKQKQSETDSYYGYIRLLEV